MKRALPFSIISQKSPYIKSGPEPRLTMHDVRRFAEICKDGMELMAPATRLEGFGCGEETPYGREIERVVRMRIVKKYGHVALMSDGHCQRWEDLAICNMNLI